MKTKKYFIIPLLAFLASSCQDEEQANRRPATGEEVQFGATLEQNANTRTIYGDETSTGFPIYWVNGDEVIVSSPECGTGNGVGTANYKVTVENATQNYATSLDKTGEIGVRWGDNEIGTFYSVYPAGQATLNTTDYKTVTLRMPFSQENELITENGVQTIQPDMRACFMYAKEAYVPSGEIVNLQYTPLSTALRFTLNGPTAGDKPITISEVQLYAPENVFIAGRFSVDLNTATDNSLPTVMVANGTNVISVLTTDSEGNFPVLESGDQLEMNVFLMLEDETPITNDWHIDIIANGVRYRKNLGSTGNPTLVPGMIHRLPEFPSFSAPEWDVSNWMKNIPRNVYLSEISLPGSWNSLNIDYQDPYTIDGQYNIGVRAFHLDTRWRATGNWYGILGSTPITDLGIANGGRTYNVDGDDGANLKCMTQDAPSFTDALGQITNNVKEDEYMVVICTFAQGSTKHGDWRQEISNACANNEKVIDASTLGPNTVVGDVLGKVIVMVNTFTEGEVADSKCLYFNMGMTLDQTEFTSQPYYQIPILSDCIDPTNITLYGTHAQITTDGNSYYNDERGYVPSIEDRKVKIQNIWNWSKDNYAKETFEHNAWLYLGLGGYIPGSGGIFGSDDDPTTVGEQFGSWLTETVNSMETNADYYPMGMVLINHTHTYSSAVQNILLMNNKYRKAYNPDLSPVTGKPIDGGVQSAAPGYSSGMTDNNTNAIGWTKVD